ncbi:hypothetical protein ACFZBE_40420 [Streptomyces sp. NPDC008061]
MTETLEVRRSGARPAFVTVQPDVTAPDPDSLFALETQGQTEVSIEQ